MSKTVLITGANRGLGLRFVSHYLAMQWQVIATCRQPDLASHLNRIKQRVGNRLEVYGLEVTQPCAIQQLSEQLQGRSIDILINNAGIYGNRDNQFGNVNPGDWIATLKVNLLAPMAVCESFVEHVARSGAKKIVTISSKMGSMGDNQSGGSYVYRSSKAAVNAIMKSMSVDLRARGICVLTLHPGWVQTDMGGTHALIDTKTSVNGMVDVIERATMSQSGGFYNYDGAEIPW